MLGNQGLIMELEDGHRNLVTNRHSEFHSSCRVDRFLWAASGGGLVDVNMRFCL